jgi:hypothetical protein
MLGSSSTCARIGDTSQFWGIAINQFAFIV